ncbi:glycosyltransferase family 4 protein [Magnetospirillum gryphiswaldense]|uniref:Glycosyltransferase n=1 Tax=Magnetospirillum gryphiswaldense TaxID=55518 RepID=A4U196_9PROT|nr:glycosyltransferase family 4 protein [Magnetospirillum gryphiswaldense]AVM75566.1 GDP-mannose-dependent alpha-(1-6)-phosphatidylinositol monomannoside mannosyltransferase [Magnetospirillum gryphiswaldense MSR-1]AVM79469.1 GDP-mannose-dependent alpha-(1-6)-phosphatidylinositol monomannoside mannosyltransferase [Magnetospirillum gryphiswaldense]CAM76653.1 Glycosyltransferase [Magnetospirillum gryphiswaldense MSR-1]
MTTRLLYLVSHPIQYQAPLLRLISGQSDIVLRVIFERDTSDGYFDPGFGRAVCWDVPLRQGYDSLTAAEADLEREIAVADVIWMHGWQGAWMRRALALAKKLNKPVLMRGENTDAAMPDGSGWRGLAKRLYLRWLFRHITVFLAVGSDNRGYYLRRGIAQDRIFPMPYAVDNDTFAQCAIQADTADLRLKLGIAPNRPVILFAGKLMPRKHPHTLLEAWRHSSWGGQAPVLLFVGDGIMAAQLHQHAGTDVIFAGFRNQAELPAFYALADIFVLASEAEPWGLAVNEAMASGTAVIVGDRVGCAADLVTPDCGAVVPAGDVQALATAMVELLPRAGDAGRAAARRIMQWDFAADIAGLRQALAWLKNTPCA